MSPQDVAASLRTCGDAVTLGGLGGLLALAGVHVLSLRSEGPRAGATSAARTWVALVARGHEVTEAPGETLALALAAAVERLGGGS